MLLDHPLKALQTMLRDREVRSEDLVREAYAVIEKHDQTLQAFISLRSKEEAIAEARELDVLPAPKGPLHGLPFSVKDIYTIRGGESTAGSKVLKGFSAPYDATVVRKLRNAGAILVGANTQDAWGHGGSSENTDFGVPRNPYAPEHVAGGSSGGTAVAVASRMVAFGIGEDTGGSIRNPASMCNISGLKVTYGRVSRYGAIAYASSLDTVGPMAKSAEDLALVLSSMAGSDPLDATSSHVPVPDYVAFVDKPLSRVRIGVPAEFHSGSVDKNVRARFDEAVQVLGSLGADVVETHIPTLMRSVPIYYLIALTETASNLGRYDGVRFGQGREHFTKETMKRILVGTYASKAGYADALYTRALRGRTLLRAEFDAAFRDCDFLIGPTVPMLPPKRGDFAKDPIELLLADICTGAVNLVGSPSLALPAGFAGPLPIGVQLIGKRFDEATLLAWGHAFQKRVDTHTRKPPFLS
jgi:aspartyl-tRNA(Asn)/glutamyl-tRNA(Gln) amidotransferase subunit A